MVRPKKKRKIPEEMVDLAMEIITKNHKKTWAEISNWLPQAKSSDVLKMTDTSIAFLKSVRRMIERIDK